MNDMSEIVLQHWPGSLWCIGIWSIVAWSPQYKVASKILECAPVLEVRRHWCCETRGNIGQKPSLIMTFAQSFEGRCYAQEKLLRSEMILKKTAFIFCFCFFTAMIFWSSKRCQFWGFIYADSIRFHQKPVPLGLKDQPFPQFGHGGTSHGDRSRRRFLRRRRFRHRQVRRTLGRQGAAARLGSWKQEP